MIIKLDIGHAFYPECYIPRASWWTRLWCPHVRWNHIYEEYSHGRPRSFKQCQDCGTWRETTNL